MKLLLGTKKYLEKCEVKDIAMDSDIIEDNDELTIPDPKTLPMKLLVSIVLHPVDCAKQLITMGHEPLPPYQTQWFGKSFYMYPNVFNYVGHIYSVDGLMGCFRGIVSKSTSLVIQNSLVTYFDKKYPAPPMKAPLLDKLKRNISVKCVCTIVAHPLQLMTVRCIAQFVGRESLFSEWNLLSNILTILKLEGISGLLKGFWARLLGDVCIVASSVILVHSIYLWQRSRDYDDEASLENYMTIYSTIVNFASVSIFYPANVVSTTMMVNEAGLKVGLNPWSPAFKNSYHCYSYLGYMNQLKRGSSLFYRWVPTVSRADEILRIKSS